MKIEEMDKTLRPREKALISGVPSLADRELLALYIRGGSRGESALDIADKILNLCGGLSGLRTISRESLVSIRGIRDVKATELLALIEISKRLHRPMSQEMNMRHPAQIMRWMNETIGYEKQEVFSVLCLDVHLNVRSCIEVFRGTLNFSQIHPRDIFREAVKHSAYKLAFVHNHPSGSLVFSKADREVTKALVACGKLMGIGVIDHFLVSGGSYASMRESQSEIFIEDEL